MVDQRNAFSLISSWDHCQKSSSSQISGTLQVDSEPGHKLSSDFAEWKSAVVITTTPWRHKGWHSKGWKERDSTGKKGESTNLKPKVHGFFATGLSHYDFNSKKTALMFGFWANQSAKFSRSTSFCVFKPTTSS